MKRCTGCGEIKEEAQFYRRHAATDKLRPRCKQCMGAERQKAYFANVDESRAKSARYMRDNYRHKHPGVAAEATRRWRERNPERMRELSRKYRESDPERRKEYMAQWRERNPERYRALHRAGKLRRRARKLSAPGDGVTPEQWAKQLEPYGGRCAYCDMVTTVSVMEHMVPLSRGGDHDICNVIPACRRCNSRKHTMTALEFFVGRRLDRKVG